jgi:hypothetical protein
LRILKKKFSTLGKSLKKLHDDGKSWTQKEKLLNEK